MAVLWLAYLRVSTFVCSFYRCFKGFLLWARLTESSHVEWTRRNFIIFNGMSVIMHIPMHIYDGKTNHYDGNLSVETGPSLAWLYTVRHFSECLTAAFTTVAMHFCLHNWPCISAYTNGHAFCLQNWPCISACITGHVFLFAQLAMHFCLHNWPCISVCITGHAFLLA